MNTTLTPEPGHLRYNDGASWVAYGKLYQQALLALKPWDSDEHLFDPVPYHLASQSLELYLKGYLWMAAGIPTDRLKNHYRHRLLKLWDSCKVAGIHKYIEVTELRDKVVSIVSPFYESRRFTYLDFDMVFIGYPALRDEPRILPTLAGMIESLRSMDDDVFRAGAWTAVVTTPAVGN